MRKKYDHGTLKKWMLPEHSLSAKENLSQNFPKVSLTNSQKETIDAITREYKEKGFTEGKKLGLQEMLNQKKILIELINQFKQYQDSCDQLLEKEIVSIIERICQSILTHELSDKYQLQKLVSDAILSFKDSQQNFKIYANPSTAEKLEGLDLPEISTKLYRSDTLGEYAFQIENNDQVVCFSIEHSIKQYINSASK